MPGLDGPDTCAQGPALASIEGDRGAGLQRTASVDSRSITILQVFAGSPISTTGLPARIERSLSCSTRRTRPLTGRSQRNHGAFGPIRPAGSAGNQGRPGRLGFERGRAR